MAQIPLVVGKRADRRRIAPYGRVALCGSRSANSYGVYRTGAIGKIMHCESLSHPDPTVHRQHLKATFYQQAINN
jgi:hypothetical protein